MTKIYDVSGYNYLVPNAYFNNDGIKYRDKTMITVIGKLYIDMTYYNLTNTCLFPMPIVNIINENRDLLAKDPFVSFYSVDINNVFDSYYFSYNLEKTDKLKNIQYTIDQNLISISYAIQLRLDGNGNLLNIYYGIKDDNIEDLQSKLTFFTETEKARIAEIIANNDNVFEINITREQNNDVVMNVR